MTASRSPRLIGVTGWKNAGKTTLVERLVAEFVRRGWRVATIKHAHHDADMDRPGTDSYRHRAAGAAEVALVGGRRYAIMHEGPEPTLAEVLKRLAPCDLVLVEGYKREPHRKIEVHRAANGKPLLFPDDPCIVGIASDIPVETRLPVAHLDDIPAIAALLRRSAISLDDVLSMSAVEG